MKNATKALSVFKKVIFVLIILFLFASFVLLPRFIKINKIKCKSQYGPCNVEVFSEITKLEGQNYLKVTKESKKILSSSEYVSEYSIKFILPNKLSIDVIEKKPSIALPIDDGKFILVNQYGQVADLVNETLLPKIYPEEGVVWNYTKGQYVDEDLKFAINLMQKIYYVYNVAEARMNNNSLSFVLADGKKIIFPLMGDSDVLFGSLQLILSRLNTESNYSIIDLRFKNPVLR